MSELLGKKRILNDDTDGVFFQDGPSVDAFGRLRTSNPFTLFDAKQAFDNLPNLWDDQEVSGSGTSSNHSVDLAASTLAVSATTAGNRTRQTFMRFNYQPGKSQFILITFLLDKTGGGTGITRELGYGDDDNGIFLVDNEGTYQVVIRSSTSGSAVDTAIDQEDWNIDPMDGTGPSGVTIDFSKVQIFEIDMEWLGVGRVRVGFNIDGQSFYVHQFLHANIISTVYMSSPNLPLRYKIANDGTGVASSMDAICASVVSEGGLENNGIIRSANIGTTPINANTTGTTYALVGLRAKTTHIGANLRIISQSVLAGTTDDFIWSIRFNPTVAGTFTYSDLSDSGVQLAYGDTAGNPSTNTVTGGQLIASGYSIGRVADRAEVFTARHLGAAIDGTRDTLVLCVTPITGNADIYGSITWRELL